MTRRSKVKGKKRHIVVDTQGLILTQTIHSASVQDRHGALRVLAPLIGRCERLACIIADRAYAGAATAEAVARLGPWRLEVVRREHNAPFRVLSKRRIVERTFRLARTLPQARQGLREPRANRNRLRAPRDDPPHAP